MSNICRILSITQKVISIRHKFIFPTVVGYEKPLNGSLPISVYLLYHSIIFDPMSQNRVNNKHSHHSRNLQVEKKRYQICPQHKNIYRQMYSFSTLFFFFSWFYLTLNYYSHFYGYRTSCWYLLKYISSSILFVCINVFDFNLLVSLLSLATIGVFIFILKKSPYMWVCVEMLDFSLGVIVFSSNSVAQIQFVNNILLET